MDIVILNAVKISQRTWTRFFALLRMTEAFTNNI